MEDCLIQIRVCVSDGVERGGDNVYGGIDIKSWLIDFPPPSRFSKRFSGEARKHVLTCTNNHPFEKRKVFILFSVFYHIFRLVIIYSFL